MLDGIKEKKVALVTGAAQGIGKAIAVKFARNGYLMAIVDINYGKLLETEKEIKTLTDCLTLKLDISISEEIKKAINTVMKKFNRIDVLVNNAGIAAFGGIEDVDNELLDRVLAINFKGAFYLCREISPIMKNQKYGKIVNVSSITAKRGDNSTAPCYGSSKGALIVLTKSLAKELGPFGINVNAVAPHAIITPMMKYWDEKRKKEAADALPVRRVGTPEDVAETVFFLARDEASFITGHVINVDGGHFMDS